MTATLRISGIRTILEAELHMEPGVTLLAGRNRAGKSSILAALAACAARLPAPYTGVATKDAPKMIRPGEQQAVARLEVDNGGSVTVTWSGTEGRVVEQTVGNALRTCSSIAVGYHRWSRMDESQRSLTVSVLCNDLPSTDELAAKLRGMGLTDRAIAAVVATVNADGWDAAARKADDEAKELRGAWKQITKQSWPRSDPLRWVPSDWDAELSGASVEQLEQQEKEARAALAKVSATRVSASKEEVAKLRELVAQGGISLRQKIEGAETRLFVANEKLRAAEMKDARLREAASGKSTPCPQCGVLLVTQHGKIVAATDAAIPSAQERKEAMDEVQNANLQMIATRNELAQLNQLAGQVKAAAERLATIRSEQIAEATDKAPGMDVDQAEQRLRLATQRVRLLRTKAEADAIARSVAMAVATRDLLAPDGLRKARLSAALERINERMAAWCVILGVPPVAIDSGLDVRMGAYSLPFLSGSEQWLTDVLVQVALAVEEGAPFLLIDGLDILREDLAAKFLGSVLAKLGTDAHVVVAAAFARPEQTPPLEKHGLGHVYWIVRDNGVELLRKEET